MEVTREYFPDIVAAAVETAWAALPPEWQIAQPAVALLSEASGRLGFDWLTRNRRTLSTASATAGLTEEALLDRLAADPARRELLRRVLETSGAALTPGKVEALGIVLARGLDDTRVDEALWVSRALGHLEVAHVMVLSAIVELSHAAPTAADLALGLGVVRMHNLHGSLPGHRLILPGILSDLERLSLVDVTYGTAPGMSIPGWCISELGRECLDLLTVAAPRSPGSV